MHWELISEFGNGAGVRVVLNASFNENKSIACRSEEPTDCFPHTKMGVLE